MFTNAAAMPRIEEKVAVTAMEKAMARSTRKVSLVIMPMGKDDNCDTSAMAVTLLS